MMDRSALMSQSDGEDNEQMNELIREQQEQELKLEDKLR